MTPDIVEADLSSEVFCNGFLQQVLRPNTVLLAFPRYKYSSTRTAARQLPPSLGWELQKLIISLAARCT